MNSGSPPSLARALFEPRTIALVGASADPTKNNARPQRFLKKHGYGGRVIPVNPGRSEIFGAKAYPDLRTVPDAMDHVFIMVPAGSVPDVIEQCWRRALCSSIARRAGAA
jgi:acetate---CoA ligase (ADP-forming)